MGFYSETGIYVAPQRPLIVYYKLNRRIQNMKNISFIFTLYLLLYLKKGVNLVLLYASLTNVRGKFIVLFDLRHVIYLV